MNRRPRGAIRNKAVLLTAQCKPRKADKNGAAGEAGLGGGMSFSDCAKGVRPLPSMTEKSFLALRLLCLRTSGRFAMRRPLRRFSGRRIAGGGRTRA